MAKDIDDPTGSRDPVIDELLGQAAEQDLAAMGIESRISGQKDKMDDPSDLKIDILTTATHVIVEFSRPVRWVNLPPELCIDFGNALTKWARKVIKKQHKR